MSEKKRSVLLALGALFIGVASIPVGSFISWVAGLVMMALPVFMIYKAS